MSILTMTGRTRDAKCHICGLPVRTEEWKAVNGKDGAAVSPTPRNNVLSQYLDWESIRFKSRWFLIIFSLAANGCDTSSTHRPTIKTSDESENRKSALASVDVDYENNFELGMRKAQSKEYSIVFLHIEWAQMADQRSLFCEFVKGFRKARPGSSITFYYVDGTAVYYDYVFEKMDGVSDLVGGEKKRIFHGNGEIVWIRHGRVVGVEPILKFTSEELVKKSEGLFDLP